jgi:hypothetical protein
MPSRKRGKRRKSTTDRRARQRDITPWATVSLNAEHLARRKFNQLAQNISNLLVPIFIASMKIEVKLAQVAMFAAALRGEDLKAHVTAKDNNELAGTLAEIITLAPSAEYHLPDSVHTRIVAYIDAIAALHHGDNGDALRSLGDTSAQALAAWRESFGGGRPVGITDEKLWLRSQWTKQELLHPDSDPADTRDAVLNEHTTRTGPAWNDRALNDTLTGHQRTAIRRLLKSKTAGKRPRQYRDDLFN